VESSEPPPSRCVVPTSFCVLQVATWVLFPTFSAFYGAIFMPYFVQHLEALIPLVVVRVWRTGPRRYLPPTLLVTALCRRTASACLLLAIMPGFPQPWTRKTTAFTTTSVRCSRCACLCAAANVAAVRLPRTTCRPCGSCV
jgi:hypothetical protein